MDYKPSELFIGLVEFISVILPGSLFTAILIGIDSTHPIYKNVPLISFYDNDVSLVFWIGFFIVSFGLGYVLNSFASILDTLCYDPIKKRFFPYKSDFFQYIINKKLKSFKKRIKKAYRDKRLTKKKYEEKVDQSNRIAKRYYEDFIRPFELNWFRRSVNFLFEFDTDVWINGIKIEESYEFVAPLKSNHLKDMSKATNEYKWSQAILDTYFPAVAEQVNRTMAVSKFFRSLVVLSVFFIVSVLAGWLNDSIPWWPGAVLLVLSFREYIVQRQKSVIAAYKGIVSLFHTSENLKIPLDCEEKITSKDKDNFKN